MNNEMHHADAANIFWNLSAEDAIIRTMSSPKGLTETSAIEKLKHAGANTLKRRSKISGFILFVFQFKSPITLLLVGAAGLSFALQDPTDAVIILTIVMVSSVLGWWQEKGATHAVDRLMKLVQIKCRVLRDAQEKDIPLEQIVPGDIVLLTAGDVVPGDSLILESKELFVDEAAFTGETYPVEKNVGVMPADTPLSQRSNSLFMASHVISGRAKALVMFTASQTVFGKIRAAPRKGTRD